MMVCTKLTWNVNGTDILNLFMLALQFRSGGVHLSIWLSELMMYMSETILRVNEKEEIMRACSRTLGTWLTSSCFRFMLRVIWKGIEIDNDMQLKRGKVYHDINIQSIRIIMHSKHLSFNSIRKSVFGQIKRALQRLLIVFKIYSVQRHPFVESPIICTKWWYDGEHWMRCACHRTIGVMDVVFWGMAALLADGDYCASIYNGIWNAVKNIENVIRIMSWWLSIN